MTKLVADISNGRTKLALAQNAEIISPVRVCPTSALSEQQLAVLAAGWSFESVVICSVVPDAAAVVKAYFAPLAPVSEVRPSVHLSVDFSGYAGCATLGADRIANAVSAAALCPHEALVVIDAGTATTADVVFPPAQEGGKARFLGGVIAPGVGTMVRALQGGTAQLPEVPLELPLHAVGQGTTEAIQNGCVRGYRGLLRELLQSMEQECGCRLRPVLTGGDAPLLAELMPELGKPEPLLTLRGIALWAKESKKC